jgi:hypothetical protein
MSDVGDERVQQLAALLPRLLPDIANKILVAQ